ncbi:HlyD family efflux transporter periplasmic adaptor subunit [Rhizobium vallis]|uniref:HlyD family efflux transporter periplasmic adaptor subunit n=1 Tax=Rhizobium vallis TaxID=634290 RepID=A0A3S0TD46_9HYPH|nr:HlyD family efflux transporter periplasmic adaptor subunit [Rhizobium vallis]RUM25846.1 HlyD family efflux transporter periplasmic adaptor subunit [Rhizobium vallis]
MNAQIFTARRRNAILMTAGAVTGLWLISGKPNASDDPNNQVSSTQIVAAARGVVDVEGGIVRISPSRDGVVAAVNVHEGAMVKAGDVLARLDDQQELLTAQISQAEFAQSQRQYQLIQLKEKSSSRQLERLRKAAAGDAVSKQSLEEASDAHASLAIELELASSARDIAQMRRDIANHQTQLMSIRSPVSGIVVRQGARVGETVSAQAMSELFSILPNTTKVIHAEIPEEFLDIMSPDMPVEIVPDSHSGVPIAGRVVRISPVLTQVKRGDSNEERSDIRTASAVIRVDGDADLHVGQRVVVKASK